MKRLYLVGLMLLLPPLQARAADPTPQDFVFLGLSGTATAAGIFLVTDPHLKSDDHYRGAFLALVGLTAVVFYKQILGIAK